MATNKPREGIRQILALIALSLLPELPREITFHREYGVLTLTFDTVAGALAWHLDNDGGEPALHMSEIHDNKVHASFASYLWSGWTVDVQAFEHRPETDGQLPDATQDKLRTITTGGR